MDTAFFVLSKIARFFIDPGNLLFVLLVTGTYFLWWGRVRFARALLTLACILSLVMIFVPIGESARIFLENRFPANPALPSHVDGIIVLGGALNPHITVDRQQPSISGSVERIVAFADLAAKYPSAHTVFSGGSGSLTEQEYKEANVVQPILIKLGMNIEKTRFENLSRNTYENAVLSMELVSPKPDEVWVLITSASHMPRAVGVFRAIGWPGLIPYPVDFNTLSNQTASPPLMLTRGLGGTARALQEGVGLLAYYLTGKTDSLVPSP